MPKINGFEIVIVRGDPSMTVRAPGVSCGNILFFTSDGIERACAVSTLLKLPKTDGGKISFFQGDRYAPSDYKLYPHITRRNPEVSVRGWHVIEFTPFGIDRFHMGVCCDFDEDGNRRVKVLEA